MNLGTFSISLSVQNIENSLSFYKTLGFKVIDGGHIPSMLSSGNALSELGSLVLDTGIGVLILFAVSKSKDIWWFFMIHYAMDMSQYYGGL